MCCEIVPLNVKKSTGCKHQNSFSLLNHICTCLRSVETGSWSDIKHFPVSVQKFPFVNARVSRWTLLVLDPSSLWLSRHQKQQEPASVSASDFGIERVNQDESSWNTWCCHSCWMLLEPGDSESRTAGGTPRRRLVGLRGQLRGDLVISIAETFALAHWTSMYKSKVRRPKTDNNFLNYSEYTRIPSSKKPWAQLELKESFSFQAQETGRKVCGAGKHFLEVTQIIINHYNYSKKPPTIWVFPKNRGTPKWMVYNGKPYWNGWFGGTTIFGNVHISINYRSLFIAQYDPVLSLVLVDSIA